MRNAFVLREEGDEIPMPLAATTIAGSKNLFLFDGRRCVSRSSALAFAIAVSGCALEPSVILNRVELGNDTQYTTDSRQRVVSTQRPKLTTRPGLVDPYRLICTEPSPDVAVAVANSLGTGLSLLNYGAGSFNASSAQGLVQLAERTVSIQLMQTLMYRACEAYSNGAISGTTYSLLMSRVSETMVTLSLGETAGGNYGRSLGSAGTTAKGSSSASLIGLPGLFDNVKDAVSKLAAAEESVQTAEAELASVKKAQEELPADATTEKRDQAANFVKEKTAARDKAVGARNALRSTLNTEIKTASEAAAGAVATGAGSILSKPDAAIAKILAEMQSTFIDRRPVLAYVDACIVEMGLGTASGPELELAKPIIEHLTQITKARSDAKATLNPEDVEAAVRLTWSARKSGLYEHCKEYLAEFLRSEREDHFRLRDKQLDNQRADIEGGHRVGEAAAKAGATKPGGAPAPGGDATPPPKPEEKPSGETLPSVAFDAAKPSLAGLIKSIGALNGATLPSVGEKFTQGDLEALKKRRDDIFATAQAFVTTANAALSDSERTRLRQLEQTRSQLVGNVRRSAANRTQNDYNKAVLAKHDADTAREEYVLLVLGTSLKSETRAVDSMVEAIGKAGK